jgi:hypothetical protein
MFEIYNERVRDLLNTHSQPGGLKVRQHPKHGFVVSGLQKIAVSNYNQVRAACAYVIITPSFFLCHHRWILFCSQPRIHSSSPCSRFWFPPHAFVVSLELQPLCNMRADLIQYRGVFVKVHERMEAGTIARTTASTQMNETSSRSHMVITVHIKQVLNIGSAESTTKTSDMHLVDLAGSERAETSGTSADRLQVRGGLYPTSHARECRHILRRC